MERLTMRNSDGSYSQPTHTTFEAMFYKLVEVEDFLEDTGISDFAELKRILTTNAVWEENQTLKGNWAKLREWLMEFGNPMRELVVSDDETKYIYVSDILDKMQELESADGEL